jgi:dipeptidyl aminopeptidase/acylaminoacyl peptidase
MQKILTRLNMVSIVVLFGLISRPVWSIEFQAPAEEITRLITATPPPTPLVHAKSGWIAMLHNEQLISQERLMSPRLGLAGSRIDPITRVVGIEPMLLKIELFHAQSPDQRRVWTDPNNARFDFVSFSPSGKYVGALRVETGKPSVWQVYELASGQVTTVSSEVNAAWGNPCSWVDDSRVVCLLIAKSFESIAAEPSPIVLQHSGKPQPSRTYSYLLETAADDQHFDQVYSSTVARLTIAGQKKVLDIESGVIARIDMAPGGRYLSLRRIEQPYSRIAGRKQFPTRVEVWDTQAGKKLYQSAPMGFGIEEAEDENTADPNSLVWRPQLPVTAGFLFHFTQSDGTSEYQWRQLTEPFDAEPVILARSQQPIKKFGWTTAGTPWLIRRTDTAEIDQVVALLADGERLLWQGNRSDIYSHPGRVLTEQGDSGPALEEQGQIYLAGSGLSATGPRPYLMALNIRSGEQRLLFKAEDGYYERALALLDPGNETILTARESETQPLALVRIEPGKVQNIYVSQDPYPQLSTVERRRVHYKRADGVALSGTLYRPISNKPHPLPTLIWIYPREYNDPKYAEQVDTKPFQYHRVVGPSPIAAALAGYAVLVSPTVPIIQNDQLGKDGYLTQLVASTDAAVDYLVANKISDPQRIAIGGRSYGAFSSVNLLIHSERFAAGIAMSGAYNRTLTPFGFQHEKRSFWDAMDYYTSISPFFHANKIKRPLLIVHGGDDINPGTPKLQARRLYHALVGEGATVRYVELPGEEHQYRGRNTVLHATWEMIHWLDLYLKNKP